MRRGQIIHEFDLLAEVLPIALAGILLNVAGRQIGQHFGGLFVDMTGTAFTAFLLGPWWAAAVASATTIINGNFFESYFPFGVVNIVGGLVWGYIARSADLANRVFNAKQDVVERYVIWALILTLAGGLACGLASTCVKLVIYPELGRPYIFGALYTRAHDVLEARMGSGVPEIFTLTLVDLARDVMDKMVVVPVAMGLVAITRIAPTFGEMSQRMPGPRLVRTDVVSIFVFGATYSAFICLAQVMRPSISITGAVREVAWLSSPMMVTLLYAPLLLALATFCFLTLRPTSPAARRLHVMCQERRLIRKKLFKAGGRWTSFARSFVLQVLGTGVSVWPLRHIIDPMFGIPLALGAIILALVAYLVIARVFYDMLQRALQTFKTVHNWLDIADMREASADVVRLMGQTFSAYIAVPAMNVARRGSLVYTLGLINREQHGRLQELFFGRGENAAGGEIAVLATIDPPHAVTSKVLLDTASLVEDTGARLVALATTTPQLLVPELLGTMRDLRKAGTEILLLDWRDIELSVASNVFNGRPEKTFRRARASALQALVQHDERFLVEEHERAAWLASRALPSLQAVVDDLPRSSMVFDLGAGFGRHTMAAALSGHDVIAVERKPDVSGHLQEDVKHLPPRSGKVNVINADFRDMTIETLGLAELLVCTGVLQHARDLDDLMRQLRTLATLAGRPAALIYIEMLFDMLFDALPPRDGRIKISRVQFEEILRKIFLQEEWSVERLAGPMQQVQTFEKGARSFKPPSGRIESVAVEYLIRRLV